jgi:hypothetical protein
MNNLKLAGFVNKRTFGLIRLQYDRPEFVACHVTNTLAKAKSEIERRRNLENRLPYQDWKPVVLLDNGDWLDITPEFLNVYREEAA